MTYKKGKHNRHGSSRSVWSSMAIFIIVGLLAYAWLSYEQRLDNKQTTPKPNDEIVVNSPAPETDKNDDGTRGRTASTSTKDNGRATQSDNKPDKKTVTKNDKKATNEKSQKQQSKYNIDKLMRVNGGTNLVSQMLQYPGFIVSFNPEYHQPNFVAWELTREEALSNKVQRTNNFQPDINVEGSANPEDYRNSGYDRGHMAPAGDMKWNIDAMNACFLMTNMSPQTNALNSGAWNKLEDKCRDWAIRDSSIIIICGPVLTDRLKKKIGKSQIPVPERYFKVILAPYADPPRGIGFIMANGKVQGGLQGSAKSIDEVEAITGFDFFPALPDKVENAVEKECNYAKWTQKQ